MRQSSSSLTNSDLAKVIGDNFLIFRLPAESYATLKETKAPRLLSLALKEHELRWATEFIKLLNLKTRNEAVAPKLTLHALCVGNETGHYMQRVPHKIWNTMSEDVRAQFSGTNNNLELTEEDLMARHAIIKSHADNVGWEYKPSNTVLHRHKPKQGSRQSRSALNPRPNRN